ncbi:MAG: MFS transporter [Mycobacteriales bacterium]
MTSTASVAADATPDVRWTPRLWGALIVLCGALFLDGLDVSMVGVALPSIQTDLHLSTSTLQWVVSGYVLGYGGLLLLGGRAADLLGRRRVFLIAVAVFAAASLLGGIVSSGPLLIVARFLKGVGAAFTAPAGLSIITTTFPEGPARNRALSIYTATGASGFSLGLVLGGLMTEVGWRWTFLLPVPIALAVLAFGSVLIPRDPAQERTGGYDLPGAITGAAATLLLVYTVVEAPSYGWASLRTIGSFALVAAIVATFVAIERRVAHPLVPLGIFRNTALVRANLGAMAMFGAYASFQFIGTLYMQNLLGWSPLEMALAFLPAGLLVAFGGPRVGGLVNRFGPGKVIFAGFLAFVPGYALFLPIGQHPVYALAILPTILLLGVGFALTFPSLNIQATAGVANHEQGLASGLVQSSIQVGGAVVLAVVTAVLEAGAGDKTPSAVLDSYRPGLAVVAGVAALGLAIAAFGLRRPRRPVEEEAWDGAGEEPEFALAAAE